MSSTDRPVIGFLTDFGLDGAAATCRAVMLSICPDAQIVDIAHTIRKYALRDAAFVLRAALPYFPVGIHVGVVDPGVGTVRRPVAIRTRRGDVLVGPDNGLLPPAADALGGVVEVRELTNRELWLATPSETFHGRDIFSPVAAHLAAGTHDFGQVGPPVEAGSLVRPPSATATVADGSLATEVTYVDSFGNVRLAGGHAELVAALRGLDHGAPVRAVLNGGELALRFVPSFGHVPAGAPVLYVDSSGGLAMAINQGDLAATHAISAGDPVCLEIP